MNAKCFLKLMALSCLCLAGAGAVSAQTLINGFMSGYPWNTLTYTGAAVIGTAGDHWNGFVGTGNPAMGAVHGGSIVDSTGAILSGVATTITATGLGQYDQEGSVYDNAGPGGTALTGIGLFRDFAYIPNGSTATVTMTGLTANQAFSLYVYGLAVGAGNLASVYTLAAANGGSSISLTGQQTSFTLGGNYGILSGTVDGSGTLVFYVNSIGTEARLNGFQLQLMAPQATAACAPQGLVTLTIQPGSGTTPQYNFLYAPLHATSTAAGVLRGKILSLTSNSLVNASAGWIASQLASTTSPTFIKITSGTAVGHTFQITSNTDTVLTVDTQGLDLSALGISVGDTYQIFSGDTILSIFGTPGVNNPIVGGASPSEAVDQVILNNGAAWISYYFNTSSGTWRQGASPSNRGSTYIRPDCAFIYSRIGAAPLSLTLQGEVPIVQHKTVTNTSGLTALAAYFPIDQTLGGLSLQNLPGWKKAGDSGITSANADKVFLNNGTAWIPYHYDVTALQWRQGASSSDRSSTAIPIGSGILLQRTGSTGAVVLTLALPYTP